MKPPRVFLSLSLTCALLLAAAALAEKTQVTVQTGAVKASTDQGTVTVAAGQKAILAAGQAPTTAVDDPMVKQLMAIDQWIQAEKKAKRVRIDHATVQMVRIDSTEACKFAAMGRMPNTSPKPSQTCRIGPTAVLQQPKYYDMKGNLLRVDFRKAGGTKAYYTVHFKEPVPPGGAFRMILISRSKPGAKTLWREGKLWHFFQSNDTRNCLNYFRVILPSSAIFVDSSPPPAAVDDADGRTALTFRNYTGEQADGSLRVAFLWPETDGTSLDDLPPQYRGLRDGRDVKLHEQYQGELRKILAGGRYRDFGTPVCAMLSWVGSIVSKDKTLLVESSYMFLKEPKLKEKMAASLDDGAWKSMRYWFVDNVDFLSTPSWPDRPEEGYIHPIHVSRPGSLMREDIHAVIYHKGRWYRLGNMGNFRNTDVSVFEKYK